MYTTATEKDHFDRLSNERRKHGFIPDLERMQNCDFFYLSPFRRRALARLALGRSSQFMVRCLKSRLAPGSRVLDLGCGSGWFSLELARAGFRVTAIDLSEGNIELARKTLEGSDVSNFGGNVKYLAADINTWEIDHADYAAVCYVGVLHHLGDPTNLVRRIHAALPPSHFMIAQEPFPENYSEVEAALALLIRSLLSATGAWYDKLPMPRTDDELRAAVETVREEYVNWADPTEGQQSPMNNSSDGHVNLRVLEQHYTFTQEQDTLSFQQRIIGGIRVGTDEQNLSLAEFVTQIEEILLARGAIKPGGRNVFGVAKAVS